MGNNKDLTEEEIKEKYEEYARNNDELLPIVKEFVLDPYIKFERSGNLDKIIDTINGIDDFLKHNIPNIDTYGLTTRGFALQTNKDFEGKCYGNRDEDYVPISYYTSLDDFEPYVIYSEGTIKNTRFAHIKCVLKDSIKLKEANDDNTGVIMFEINPVEDDRWGLEINKLHINNGKLFREKFIISFCSRRVETKVYNLDYILLRPSSINECDPYYSRDFIITPNTENILHLPKFIRSMENIMDSIVIKEEPTKPGEYMVVEDKRNIYRWGTCLEGDSLYDAYYKEMVARGYFQENSIKKNSL